jgi:hypothetical protein
MANKQRPGSNDKVYGGLTPVNKVVMVSPKPDTRGLTPIPKIVQPSNKK